MAASLPITRRALSAAASSSAGDAVDIEYLTPTSTRVPRSAAEIKVELTDLVGDTALSVSIETSSDGSVWTLAKRIDVVDVSTVETVVAGRLRRFVRASWALSGSAPSATFSVGGEAHQLFCEPEHITSDAVPEHALSTVGDEKRIRACLVGSTEVEGYLASAYTTPILGWGADLTEKTALIAAAKRFNHRGRDPEGPDKGVFDAAAEAVAWCNRIARGRLKPPGIIDSTPAVFERSGSVVVRNPSRGW